MTHLEAGQRLESENVTASTATLVPGCGNMIIDRIRIVKSPEEEQERMNENKNKNGTNGNRSDRKKSTFRTATEDLKVES